MKGGGGFIPVVVLVVFLQGCQGTPRLGFEKPSEYRQLYNSVSSFYADFTLGYDRVWWSAIDTLDAWGYVIIQMDEKRGYISTELREVGDRRTRISMRFYRLDGVVRVVVKAYGFRREFDKDGRPHWYPLYSVMLGSPIYGDRLEDVILEDMIERLGL